MNLKIIAIKDIKVKDNIRGEVDTDLVENIKDVGILQPLLVRKNCKGFELIAGGRRFAAAKEAGLKEVPCLVREIKDSDILSLQMIENLQRKDMNALKEAEALKKMGEIWSAEEIASIIGKSPGYVRQRLVLLDLLPQHKKALGQGKITPGHAVVILRLPDKKQQQELFGEIISEKLSIRQAEAELSGYTHNLNMAPFDKQECLECQSSGASQKDLFDKETNLKGECLNPKCFEKKSLAFIAELKDKLEQQGRTVFVAENLYESPNKAADMQDYIKKELGVSYRTQCKKCESLLAVIRPNGKIDEFCTKPNHLKILQRAAKGEVEGTNTEQHPENRRQENRVEVTRREFFIEKIQEKLNPEVAERLLLAQILKHKYDETTISEFLKEHKLTKKNISNCDYEEADVLKLFSKIPDKIIRKELSTAIAARVKQEITTTLAELTNQVGVSIKNDFEVSESYLNRMTKVELSEVAKEFKVELPDAKKPEMIEQLMKADLKGKVPKELVKA